MVIFLTNDWIKDFKEILNGTKEYEEAAKNWEGDFLFVIDKVASLEQSSFSYYVDLWHGKARDCFLVTEEKKLDKDTEYIWSGSYENWKLLIQGKVDPIKGLMTRKFKLKGNMSKVLRASKAAKELVACASKVTTEFPV